MKKTFGMSVSEYHDYEAARREQAEQQADVPATDPDDLVTRKDLDAAVAQGAAQAMTQTNETFHARDVQAYWGRVAQHVKAGLVASEAIRSDPKRARAAWNDVASKVNQSHFQTGRMPTRKELDGAIKETVELFEGGGAVSVEPVRGGENKKREPDLRTQEQRFAKIREISRRNRK
ncbi:MAG: hypothetical protein IID40_08560 [Planctomycetes bacterium]|nr:hypothetical protein [Planctomycetota bacterium]